jgi:hypothetical protein
MQAAKHGLLRRRLLIEKQLCAIFFRGWLELESMIATPADFWLSMLTSECFYVRSTPKADLRHERNVRRPSVAVGVRSLSTSGDAGWSNFSWVCLCF